MGVRLVYDIFHHHFWGTKIALDLFLGGIGVGSFLFAVMIDFFLRGSQKKISRIAAYLTPICVALGFFFLILDLGRPERFYMLFFNFNVTSPLSWGAYLQTIFFIISILYALMWFAESGKIDKFKTCGWLRNSKLREFTGFLGVPFALGVGVYHGFFLMVFKARPLWNTGPITVMAIFGFIMTGIASVVLILALSPRAKELLNEIKISRNVLGVAIILQLFTIALWMSSLYFGPGQSHQAMLRVILGFAYAFWGGVIFLGLTLPLLIGGLAILGERRKGGLSLIIPIISSLMVLIGGLIFRYIIIMAGQ